MRPIVLTRQLATADPNGIAEAQAVPGAVDLTLNGVLVVDGVAVLDAQRRVALFSAGNIAAVIFTVYGRDYNGVEISDTVTGINNTTVETTLDFLEVTRIAASATTGAETVIAGTTEVGASQPLVLDIYLNPVNASVKVSIEGTLNVTVQYTNDPIFDTAPGDIEWTDDTDLDALTTGYTTGTIISPITALRLLTNSGDGAATITITQSGATG